MPGPARPSCCMGFPPGRKSSGICGGREQRSVWACNKINKRRLEHLIYICYMFSSSSPSSWGLPQGHKKTHHYIKPQQSFSGTFCRIGPCKPGGHGSVVGTGLLQENQMPPISRLLCLSSNSCPNSCPNIRWPSSSVFHRYPWIEVSPQLVS